MKKEIKYTYKMMEKNTFQTKMEIKYLLIMMDNNT